jgi:hypothetical protein
LIEAQDDELDKRLRKLGASFRARLEAVPLQDRYLTLQRFPRGSCGDASLLHADYLRNQGYQDIAYVLGVRGIHENRHSHAWLVVEGFIIDITGDQFAEITEPVIVCRASNFHDSFEWDLSHTSNYRDYNVANNYPSLPSTYRAVMDAMSGHI